MREVTASGQTVEEAVQSALKQLSMSRDEVEIEVIDRGKKGFLGLFGATRAIVKVREKSLTPETDIEETKEDDYQVITETKVENKKEAVDQEEASSSEEELVINIKEAEQYLKSLAENMGVTVEIKTTIEEKRAVFELFGDKIAILIGKRGKTLNAIQYLTQLVINKNGRKFHSVIVDAEGYRKRREETLKELAGKMASKAIRIDGKVALEPMPAYERKIIHSSLQQSNRVTTYSDGVEPHRYIVIEPK